MQAQGDPSLLTSAALGSTTPCVCYLKGNRRGCTHPCHNPAFALLCRCSLGAAHVEVGHLGSV